MSSYNNSTTLVPEVASDKTLEQILTVVEATASVLGIIGAITLVTGFVSFMCSQWNRHKDNINNALDTEQQRRHKEGVLLKGLPGSRPFIPFDPDGSVFSLTDSGLPTIVAMQDGQERPNHQKVTQTLARHTQERDQTIVNRWLTTNKEHINKKDAKGYTALHHLPSVIGTERNCSYFIGKTPSSEFFATVLLSCSSGEMNLANKI